MDNKLGAIIFTAILFVMIGVVIWCAITGHSNHRYAIIDASEEEILSLMDGNEEVEYVSGHKVGGENSVIEVVMSAVWYKSRQVIEDYLNSMNLEYKYIGKSIIN